MITISVTYYKYHTCSLLFKWHLFSIGTNNLNTNGAKSLQTDKSNFIWLNNN